jgi:hypothetical protein
LARLGFRYTLRGTDGLQPIHLRVDLLSSAGVRARIGKIMHFLASRMSLLLIPAALLLSGTAMATPRSAQDTTTTISDQAGVPLEQLAVFIRGGCPYNLDKECHRKKGKMVCRCVS